MLPAGSRLHTSDEFAAVVRLGRRSAAPRLVVHLLTGHAGAGSTRSPRVGFVVSGKVGNAVIRHRVTRRLRALVRSELAVMPAGADVVVRALPGAAAATSSELGVDLRSALAGAMRKARGTAASRSQARVVGAGR
ncbi:MAG TPA: ribonuclease P protein component [Nakamurella sp.]